MSNLHTTIRAACPACGDIDLTPPDVHLHTYAPSDGRDFYEFICPACGDLVQKDAGPHIIALLRSGSVPETRTFLPIEALDPMRRLGEPFSEDDVLDFVLDMHCTAFLPADLWRRP